jgi:small-conductance mechanosensitive channel
MTLGYDIPWTTIHKLMLEAADRTEDVLKEPKPFILQTGLDDFYVSYQLNTYIKEANKQAVIYSNLYRNTLDVFNEAGVEILSPHYRAVRDGNAPAMPPKED